MLGSADDARRAARSSDGELRYYDNRFPIAPGTERAARPQEVHARQHYELVDWRRADADLNYRRFFAINTLAGLRVEDPAVFDATHELVLQLVRDGAVDGLRIDHPDGLADPEGYLDRLAEASGGRWTVVEKILEPGEDLPRAGRTAGTTGYDALAEVDGVLVDPAGEAALTALDTELAGRAVDYARAGARLQARGHRRHARLGGRPAGPGDRRAARRRPAQQTEALAELLATFPVYRSYLPDGREHLDATVAAVRERRPDLAAAVDALHPVLAQAGTEAATRFEQTSGPVMAKGVEDSAYYRWARFVALNEVGGDPARFGSDGRGVPRRAAAPAGALARLDDHAVDARHQAQRGRPGPARRARRARRASGRALVRRLLDRHPLADRPLAHLVWQNLVGAWPLSRGAGARLRRRRPPGRRARRPRWTDPDEAFEEQLHALVDAAYDDAGDARARSRRSSTGSRRSAGRTRCRRSCCS